MQIQATTINKQSTNFTAKDFTFEGMAPKQTRVEKYAELKKAETSKRRTSELNFSKEKEPVHYSTREERKKYQKQYKKESGIMGLLLSEFGKGSFQKIATSVTDSTIAVFNALKSKYPGSRKK
ncbi:hypothetical protein [Bacillus bombysepticus]|uniref:hypothetical protein n=1 Tax=Bacillus bombysepticus TaxID=658666 RepID=UPI00301A0CC4